MSEEKKIQNEETVEEKPEPEPEPEPEPVEEASHQEEVAEPRSVEETMKFVFEPEPDPEPVVEAPHEKEEIGPVEKIITDTPPEKKPWWKFW